ncbi:MAG: hypothetical protein Q8K86_00190 [Candidatus Nanopelagicaceae bacterium]|nr:hypothetical protein [Candidatus Nanopelagicaceae bacterium]
MPGFLPGKVPSSQKFFLQHFWYAFKIGDLDINTPLLLQDVKLPNADFDVLEKEGASLYYKYAKFAKWTDAVFTFYDLDGLATQLEKWRELIWTPTGGIQPKSNYAKETIVQQTDGKGAPKVTHTMYNTWPRVIEQGPLAYDRSEARLVIVTLAVDYMESK